jgi:hypothetical protein
MPVGSTMYHHAIEMILKGFLVKNHTSSRLKKIGHNLLYLWEMYKSEVNNARLARFDKTITELDKVESLRYPDEMVKQGYILNWGLGSLEPAKIPDSNVVPQYFINVSDLDSIAFDIFTTCNINPKSGFRNIPIEFIKELPIEFRPWE